MVCKECHANYDKKDAGSLQTAIVNDWGEIEGYTKPVAVCPECGLTATKETK